MRILRCEACSQPCMLTVLSEENFRFCPVKGETAQWRQINIRKHKSTAHHENPG